MELIVHLCRPRCIGFARRRMGRGGRILLDRTSSNYDDMWSRLDYTIFDTVNTDSQLPNVIETKMLESTSEKTPTVDDMSSDRLTCLNPPIQNNHHNNNFVIKSENSKNHEISDEQIVEKSRSVNNQKLDDFEQLLDSASASSNIINKKLVCRNNSDISDDSFMLKASGSSSLSQNDLMNKNLSVGLLNSLNCEASSSGVSSTNGSLSFNLSNALIQETVPIDPNKSVNEDEDDDEDFLTNECSNPAEDFYTNLLDEIKSGWLHFRPKTPPPHVNDVLFESDLTDKTKKYAVELQMLDDGYDETEMNSYTDNVYMSQPMSFNFCNQSVLSNDDLMHESVINVKTEPADKDYDSIDEVNMSVDEPIVKSESTDQDAIKRLLEKYQNDVANDDSEIDVNELELNFDECLTSNDTIGCSSFKLFTDDFTKNFKTESSEKTTNDRIDDLDGITIKSEISEFSSDQSMGRVQSLVKESPIAELQSHNYVLQYGSPVPSNTVTLNSIANNTNMISVSPTVGSTLDTTGMNPATTLFQQQFINSGNTIISTQSQQNKLQPIVYDNNTIVLAAPTRKQMNGPDRNRKYYKSPYY